MSDRKGVIYAADLFCGAGGSSSGLLHAAEALGLDVELLAVNHWEVAIATHSANHPGARHLCQSIESINPREAVPDGKLDLLWASPECTHFSSARGGKPMSDQSRASAWCVLRWLEALDVRNVIIENVAEFTTWGPLHAEDHADEKRRLRPVEKQKGRYFRNFVRNLKCLGYRVDWKVLNAANYGAATTRQRLFILARKGRKSIIWPEPTHVRELSRQPDLGLAPPVQRWRPAREIIDWTLPSKSIYARERPLAENTMRRILAGLSKFSGLPFIVPNFGERDGQAPRTHSLEEPLPSVTGHGAGALVQPWLVVLRNNCDGKSVDGPAPTIAANGGHIGLAEPFLIHFTHQGEDAGAHSYSPDRPLPTLTTQAELGLVEPFLVGAGGPTNGGKPHSVEEPLGAVLAENHRALVEPFVVAVAHTRAPDEGRVYSPDEPLRTISTRNCYGVAEPYLVNMKGQSDAASLDEPAPTVTAHAPHLYLAEPFILPHQHGTSGPENVRSVDEPLPTVTGQSADMFLAEPYLVQYHNGRDSDRRTRSVEEPLPTLDTSNRVGLAEPVIVAGEQEVETFDPTLLPYVDPAVGSRPEIIARAMLAQMEPFLLKYASAGRTAESVDEPLDTVSTRDRFALVSPELVRSGAVDGRVVGWLDIRFRMLQPHELGAAMGFPADYQFTGTREQRVRQIGNAVERHQAEALCRAILGDEVTR